MAELRDLTAFLNALATSGELDASVEAVLTPCGGTERRH
jgi:hypothetical protein